MRINPILEAEPDLEPAQEAMRSVGLLPPKSTEKLSPVQEALERSNLGINELTGELSFMINDSRVKEATRLRAIETAMKMHGALREEVKPTTNEVHIHVQGDSIIGILTPR